MSSNGRIASGADIREGTHFSSFLNETAHAGGDQDGAMREDNWLSLR